MRGGVRALLSAATTLSLYMMISNAQNRVIDKDNLQQPILDKARPLLAQGGSHNGDTIRDWREDLSRSLARTPGTWYTGY